MIPRISVNSSSLTQPPHTQARPISPIAFGQTPSAQKPLTIGIITHFSPTSPRLTSFQASAKKRGHQLQLINPQTTYLNIQSNYSTLHQEDGSPIKTPDIILSRRSLTENPHFADTIARYFELQGVPILNSTASIALANDKLATHLVLSSQQIPMPHTTAAGSEISASQAIKAIPTSTTKALVKGLHGAGGKEVFLESGSGMLSRFLWLCRHKIPSLFQQFALGHTNSVIRCFVVDSKIVTAKRRSMPLNQFKSSEDGVQKSNYPLSPQQYQQILKSVKSLGLDFAVVDLAESNTGELLLLEVNGSLGIHGDTPAALILSDPIIELAEKRVAEAQQKKARALDKTA